MDQNRRATTISHQPSAINQQQQNNDKKDARIEREANADRIYIQLGDCTCCDVVVMLLCCCAVVLIDGWDLVEVGRVGRVGRVGLVERKKERK